jgi:hypothetical protein
MSLFGTAHLRSITDPPNYAPERTQPQRAIMIGVALRRRPVRIGYFAFQFAGIFLLVLMSTPRAMAS